MTFVKFSTFHNLVLLQEYKKTISKSIYRPLLSIQVVITLRTTTSTITEFTLTILIKNFHKFLLVQVKIWLVNKGMSFMCNGYNRSKKSYPSSLLWTPILVFSSCCEVCISSADTMLFLPFKLKMNLTSHKWVIYVTIILLSSICIFYRPHMHKVIKWYHINLIYCY